MSHAQTVELGDVPDLEQCDAFSSIVGGSLLPGRLIAHQAPPGVASGTILVFPSHAGTNVQIGVPYYKMAWTHPGRHPLSPLIIEVVPGVHGDASVDFAATPLSGVEVRSRLVLSTRLARTKEADSMRALILSLLESIPVEDGITHAAEEVLERTLKRTTRAAETIWRILEDVYDRPSIASGLLQCIGRLDYKYFSECAIEHLRSALGHKSVEVREAAIGAIELWEATELQCLLADYHDPVQWVAEYAVQVARDLREREWSA